MPEETQRDTYHYEFELRDGKVNLYRRQSACSVCSPGNWGRDVLVFRSQTECPSRKDLEEAVQKGVRSSLLHGNFSTSQEVNYHAKDLFSDRVFEGTHRVIVEDSAPQFGTMRVEPVPQGEQNA